MDISDHLIELDFGTPVVRVFYDTQLDGYYRVTGEQVEWAASGETAMELLTRVA